VIEGLLGRKLGMVQLFDKQGRLRGATVIEAGPCLVTQVKSEEKDGYRAAQVGYGAKKHTNKPMRGHLKRLGDLRYLREFRIDDPDQHKVGDRVGVEIFQEGDRVDVTGVSKGRGFAGGVKRYGFRGGPKTHGQSDRHRAPGAIGAGNTPGRVFKGLRMAGHMGAEQVTVRNLEVLESNPARGLLLLAGAVPGARNGLLKIRYSKHTREVARGRKAAPPTKEAPAAESEDQEETPVAESEAPAGETEQEAVPAQEAAEVGEPEGEEGPEGPADGEEEPS
jgi:large subunit ribosomal protein L3